MVVVPKQGVKGCSVKVAMNCNQFYFCDVRADLLHTTFFSSWRHNRNSSTSLATRYVNILAARVSNCNSCDKPCSKACGKHCNMNLCSKYVEAETKQRC